MRYWKSQATTDLGPAVEHESDKKQKIYGSGK
jgi:hypothetical protein